jgi:Phage terminase, small subunit
MGNHRSGRRRVPTAIKQLRGSKIRHDISREPAMAVGEPPMPVSIGSDPYAAEEWAALAKTLLALHVLTPAHGPALAVLAQAQADMRRKLEEWETMGRRSLVREEWFDKQGTLRVKFFDNPLCKQIVRQQGLITRLLGEFGLTAATSSKVQTHAPQADDFAALEALRPEIVPFKKRA